MISREWQYHPKIPCHALLASGGVIRRMWKSDKFTQSQKQLLPKYDTEAGRVTEVRLVQPTKQTSAKVSMVSGILVFIQPAMRVLVAVSMMALHPSRES